MKDLKGRQCSPRHFKRGNNLVPVMIPLAWKKEWGELNKKCIQSGEKVIPEEKYWQWRQALEKKPPYRNIFYRSLRFLQSLKQQFLRSFNQH